jgi:glycosyltransferase involved in cell wall biosynthesis
MMRVGLIAPPWVPVPPPRYGGTEEVIDDLARGLVSLGHDVTLFTTGNSTCDVDRRWVFAEPPAEMNLSVPECRHVQAAYDELVGCDVIHDHTTLGPIWAQAQRITTPIVTTVHNAFTPENRPVLRHIARFASIVAISHSHRATAPDVPVAAVIRHGIDASRWRMGDGSGGYALFLGRFSPEKGAALAVRIARRAGVPLVIAAKMRSPAEREYFETQIEPALGPDAQYVGEIDRQQREELLRGAVALLNPICWAEPFGMVMIQALACGTPVVSFPHGAAPEIVVDGVTGFLPRNEAEAIEALRAATQLNRMRCRAAVEGYFSARRMVADHVALYSRMAERSLGLRAG